MAASGHAPLASRSDPPYQGERKSATGGDAAGMHVVRSQDLLGPGAELWIAHNNKHYRLRVTAQGKLILTA